MKIEMQLRISAHHLTHETQHLQGIQYAQRIRKHEATNVFMSQCIYHGKYIVRRMFHTVTPILQVDIDTDTQLRRISQRRTNIRQMFFRAFLQLVDTMVQGSLTQQVDILTTTVTYPVQRSMSVDKPQHLHAMQPSCLPCPLTWWTTTRCSTS